MALSIAAGRTRLPGALLVAAATLGVAELALYRVVAPILSHIPDGTVSHHLVDAARLSGERAFHGTALLVVLGTVAYLVADGRRPATKVLIAAVLTTTLLAAVSTAPAARLVAHATFMVAVAALAGTALADRTRVYALAVTAAALSLLAGRLPLVLDAVAAVRGGLDSGGGVATAATAAEAAFLLVPLLLAIELVRRRSPPLGAWFAAVAASLVVAAVLASSPVYTAIVSRWATGVTLSLPVPLYVTAAGALALVLTTCLATASHRLLAVGLVLFVVAGTEPAVVHHNITAVLALALMATSIPEAPPSTARRRAAAGRSTQVHGSAADGLR